MELLPPVSVQHFRAKIAIDDTVGAFRFDGPPEEHFVFLLRADGQPAVAGKTLRVSAVPTLRALRCQSEERRQFCRCFA